MFDTRWVGAAISFALAFCVTFDTEAEHLRTPNDPSDMEGTERSRLALGSFDELYPVLSYGTAMEIADQVGLPYDVAATLVQIREGSCPSWDSDADAIDTFGQCAGVTESNRLAGVALNDVGDVLVMKFWQLVCQGESFYQDAWQFFLDSYHQCEAVYGEDAEECERLFELYSFYVLLDYVCIHCVYC